MIGKTLSVLSYSCFIVAYRPSQSILKFRAKFQIANGFHTEQREPTINLRDFVTSVNTLKSSAAKQVVDDKLSMNFYSAAQLVGAVVGYEGSNIFPSVLLDKIKWQPPVQMLETVKSIVTGKSKQDIAPAIMALLPSDINGDSFSWLPQTLYSAGWPIAGKWLQFSSVCDSIMYRKYDTQAREPYFFRAAQCKTLDSGVVALISSETKFGRMDFQSPAREKLPHRQSGVPVYFVNHIAVDAQDSTALLACATSLINEAVTTNIDRPLTGYSIVTNGQTWRFVALQINTLDFQGALENRKGCAVKNAAWVYESQLYHQRGEEVVVDPEVLGILHNIVCGDDGNKSL